MSTVQNFGKGVIRVAKNYTKGYSDVQAKVREATSNDPWGPSGTQMNELAQLTYNQNDFIEIMEMLDKRLNDKGKNWRHVFKSLTVLDYLLHAGSENVVIYFRDNLYVIKTLKEFQFVDEYGKDQGANVRQKAKDISNLLMDEARLRQERRSRANMRDRMVGSRGELDEEPENENSRRRSRTPPRGAGRKGGDDDELRRAIEESKRSLAEEQSRKGVLTAEERDLQQAIKLSEEEERKRAEELAKSGQNNLFDDQSNNLVNLNAETNPFPLVDAGGTNGFNGQFAQQIPQFTSFNPYQAQMQQEALQAEYMRQQQEWQQQQQLQQQQELFAQQQAQQQQEEWFRQQQLLQLQQQQQQQQQLVPQPTGFGSNNPFAAFGSGPSNPSNGFLSPSPQPPQPSTSPVSFNLQGTYGSSNGPSHSSSNLPTQSSFSPPPQPQSAPPAQRGPTRADQEHAHLASLFANRDDGVDTFGNYGQLRYGPQGGHLISQQTGAAKTNPFAQQQRQQQQSGDQPFFSI
ncbi:ENTH-domain-containing protein [Trametopsis cervina]|nr:ENTH-domain-containing protein [Trametopsis cervina]